MGNRPLIEAWVPNFPKLVARFACSMFSRAGDSGPFPREGGFRERRVAARPSGAIVQHRSLPIFPMKSIVRFLFLAALLAPPVFAAAESVQAPPRERLLMDAGWRFAFGHPSDPARDFDHATGYFSYVAKAGYGDGPAAAAFDDRGVASARPAARLGGGGAVRRERQPQPWVQGHRPQLPRAFHRLVSQDVRRPGVRPRPAHQRRVRRRVSRLSRVDQRLLPRPPAERLHQFQLRPDRLSQLRRRQCHRGPGGRHDGGGMVLRGRGHLSACLAGQDRAAARAAMGHVCDHRGGRRRGQCHCAHDRRQRWRRGRDFR